MTVYVDMLGAPGGPAFPPKGTQLQNFSDNFQRADAGTLGSRWGMLWGYADAAVGSEAFWPQSCALNPRIEMGQCIWWSRREGRDNIGRGYSLAWPWPLAWMTQGRFDQYSEIEVTRLDAYPDTVGILATVFSGNPGSLDPDEFGQSGAAGALPGEEFQGQYGFYSMAIGQNPDGSSGFSFIYNLWGGDPSTMPDGLRGHAGINYLSIPTTYVNTEPLAPLPAVFRMESRWRGGRWEFQGFQNGVLVATASHSHLIQGCPAMGGSAYYTGTVGLANPNHLITVRNFKAGLLPEQAAPVPEWSIPADSQRAWVAHYFNEPIQPKFSVSYVGVDSPDMGLALDQTTTPYYLKFVPIGNIWEGRPWQAMVLLAPLQLAWYTQARQHQRSTITVVNLNQTNVGGMSSVHAICCYTGSTVTPGQAYSLTAATVNDPENPEQRKIILHIQRFDFGNIPALAKEPYINTGGSADVRTAWLPTELLDCGTIEPDTRIWLEAYDLGDEWQLTAMTVDHPDVTPWQYNIRGTVRDSAIGAGMPALAAGTWASQFPITVRDYASGWGPNDVPFVTP